MNSSDLISKPVNPSAGCFSFVLHAHQPLVLHHGTWPHGLEWLLEAATETYLPLLRVIRRLSSDGVPFHANVSLSPVLLEQLAHPDFRAELLQYLQRKILSAKEDAAFFAQAGEHHLLYLARHWDRTFSEALAEFEALDGNLIAGFQAAEQNGSINLMTSAATHGYAPLIGTDGSLRGQFQTAVRVHKKHFGSSPTGVWLPECGYRPTGSWQPAVAPAGSSQPAPVKRVGVETALADAGLRFTIVDSHLVNDAEFVEGPPQSGETSAPSLYRPYGIADSSVAVFARDPRSAFQVWSARFGYPGDFAYLDFHKKRWPGGHRYWRVTGADLGMEAKQPYYPEAAEERSRAHADHFAGLVADTLRAQARVDDAPPMLCAPFDLELFGHWWHEGVLFLENVARALAAGTHGVQPMTCDAYLQQYGTAGHIRMHEGSWGSGGDSSVWLNSETEWLLSQMYAAEFSVDAASRCQEWKDGGDGERIARQMCRELLLMESSDWPTLITTGAARDYAERRFNEHAESFRTLRELWAQFLSSHTIDASAETVLHAAEQSDGIFPEIDPADWLDVRV
jgi:1,4-alpha-glucan branching enzyme